MNNPLVAGVDIGGSHITAALVDLEVRSVLPAFCARKRINAQEDAASIIDNWCATIGQVFEAQPTLPRRVGIAMPGPFDYEKGISFIKDQNKYEALYGLNVKEMMAERLGVSPDHIRLMNDAGCFLQGEVVGGAARGFKSAVGVTLGTGLGTATFHGGVAKDANLWCAPFLDGIAEDYISARWLIKKYQEVSGTTVEHVKELVSLIPDDPRIKDIFKEFGQNLAAFLTTFIRDNNPEVVVIGGNISKSAEWFVATVEEALLAQSIDIPVRIARLGENAHIMGAAGCWIENI
ncbi:ROK family protein [Pseudoflavitalea sp. X16]|uniref:ROK family protein n=1 Tax=Paraflavitalea devenefica TaxID=2716334 RepID=UPI0014248AC6|nr:ROK family protein [Paraflavitalea devenefica]NII27272.1 ROK family protein [Paraflavitalea devenefica]